MCGTACHRTFDETWTWRISSINWNISISVLICHGALWLFAILHHRNTLTYLLTKTRSSATVWNSCMTSPGVCGLSTDSSRLHELLCSTHNHIAMSCVWGVGGWGKTKTEIPERPCQKLQGIFCAKAKVDHEAYLTSVIEKVENYLKHNSMGSVFYYQAVIREELTAIDS